MKAVKKIYAFTLVEVIVVIAILMIIVTLSYSFFFFELNTFTHGTNRSSIQFETRTISDKITTLLRYSESLSLSNSGSGTYISGPTLNTIYSGLNSKFSYLLDFYATNDARIVKFVISTTDSQTAQTFQIETEVTLLNTTIDLMASPVLNNPYSVANYVEPIPIP